MRFRYGSLGVVFIVLVLGMTFLSACAGAPPTVAGIIGGLGSLLSVGVLALFLGASQSGCGEAELCLSPPPPRDACLTFFRDAGGNEPDGGVLDAGPCLRDTGVRDSGPDDAGDPDGGRRDTGALLGVPQPEYIASHDTERRDVIDALRARGVIPDELADELEDV